MEIQNVEGTGAASCYELLLINAVRKEDGGAVLAGVLDFMTLDHLEALLGDGILDDPNFDTLRGVLVPSVQSRIDEMRDQATDAKIQSLRQSEG